MQSELTELEEKLSLGNQLLAYDIDLKSADSPEDIGEKAKNIENLEQFMVSLIDKLKACDSSNMTEEQRIDMERKLDEAMSLINKLHALRESISSHLKSLADWKTAEGELEDEIRVIMDNIEGLRDSYSQPQPYPTAINDVNILQRLQDQIMKLLQKTIDKEQTLSQNLPNYHPAINAIKQQIEKATEDVKKLLPSLIEDVSTEKQLVDIQNDLINQLNGLNDRAIVIRNEPHDETQIPRLEELKNELEEVGDMLKELKEKENKPMKLVLHSDDLKITSVVDQYEKVNRLLNETKEQLANQVASTELQSTVSNEAQELHYIVDEAYKVENDVNATASDLRKAIDDLKNGRSHLTALKNAYDQLENVPDMNLFYENVFDEISTLNEQYDNVERNLEDRLDMLNEFDVIADSVNKRLMDLEDNVHKLEVPSASCELSVADKGLSDVNELQESLKKLHELKEQLTPLLKPASTVENFDNRLADVSKNFQQWHDESVKKKQELEAENNLLSLINDFEQTLVNAENDFEKLEGTMNALKSFKDMILPIVVEKSDRIRDLILPVKTENIKQLYHNVDMLNDRFNDLSTRVNDKLNDAERQENLFDDIQRELNNMEQKTDDFIKKYTTSQDLLIAMEDVDQLYSLQDQIPSLSAMENITEDGLKDNLIKKADTMKNKIENLLVPLKKDIQKEQELMRDLHETLSTLTAIGDDVIAVDPNTESLQQLESIHQLAENLRQLKGKIEKLEEKLQSSEGMVKHALVTDDLFGRVVQLQDALDDKKEKLTERAKLCAITPEINLINESVQNYINEMEQIPMQTIEEQNVALSELEGKKYELENLLKNIPQGDEGSELREKCNWLLGQLNDVLKRLADAVGEKFTALGAFNVIKDEVEAQISSLQSVPASISGEYTVFELDNQLHDINVETEKLQKLREKILHANVSELDREQYDERSVLLSKIDESLQHAQKNHEYFNKKRIQLLAHEKICADSKALYDELEKLVKDGEKLLSDSEALPISYGSTADALSTLTEKAINLRINEPEIEQSQKLIFKQLWELVDNAKDVQTQLIQRAYMWEQFVKERDSALEELNDIRGQIHEIDGRGMRRFDKMLDDLEALKVLYLRWSFLANLQSRLLSLSSQLHPLTCAQREGKAYAEEASELEKKFENLLDSMSAEFRVREEIVHSLLVISDELDDIRNVLDAQNITACSQKELQQHLEGIRAHLSTLDQDIAKYNDNRIFLSEETEISTRHNFERLEEIEGKLKRVEFTDTEEEYDIDAAAEVLAAIYPDDHPRDVLREQGIPFDDDSYDHNPSSATSDDDDKNKFKTPLDDEIMLEESEEDAVEAHPSHGVVALSPIPDDPGPGHVHYERQRSRWRRVLRTALPLQAMLVLLLGAACLVPHCDDESCCQLLNNFARSFDPSLEFLNGPPPF
ncbi:unnamed protein product [Acanthocheilonema viteae]|uniref:KASH domain-containing protein n=1 Tax=Acanthocheilonema viteae TaxID=6277 RepID=A0A498SSF9_ACAVI|nr:unnamed protein product [Acanthocheilonema viteae]